MIIKLFNDTVLAVEVLQCTPSNGIKDDP